MIHRVSTEIGGLEFTIEMGKVATQADGAAYVCYGDTVVLATACALKVPREGVDFFPLTVDYRENTYAAGKIPGGFFKREGRPTEKEILTSRLTDRSRPRVASARCSYRPSGRPAALGVFWIARAFLIRIGLSAVQWKSPEVSDPE